MLEVPLVLGGVTVQAAALAALLHGDGAAGALLAYLAMQALAAALLAMPLRRLLSRRVRVPSGATLVYLFAAGAFVPLGGVLVALFAVLPSMLVGMAPSAWRPRALATQRVALVSLPDFASGPMSCVAPRTDGNDRLAVAARRPASASADAGAADAHRLSALAALQARPARSVSPLLHALLDDDVEDVRLLAYGMLDAAERRLTRRILQAQDRLHALGDGDAAGRAATHEQLAQLHWELVYQNLVQGDVRSHTLAQADLHAEAALRALSEAPGATTLYVSAADGSGVASPVASLWQLRGRLALARRDPAAARAALRRATALGFPRQRALPLLAEAAFMEGDFAAVTTAMRSLRQAASLPAAPQLQPLLRYWTS